MHISERISIAAPGNLPTVEERIPPDDFINSKFDIRCGARTSDVLLILSTPRSGSTVLCDLLYRNGVCLAHEYFQPYDYMPLLAKRWDCIGDGFLDEATFVQKLLQLRTLSNGWLGINLHGQHLEIFSRFETYFPSLRTHYVHLVRRDTIAQAVSFEIAMQTGRWSSHFEALQEPKYDYHRILRRLEAIRAQNSAVIEFLKAKSAAYQTVCYEDLLSAPEATLRALTCISPGQQLQADPGLKKQSTERNRRWMRRFALERQLKSRLGYSRWPFSLSLLKGRN